MNEEHVLAAILTAGLAAKSSSNDLTPKDVVGLYGVVLAELLAAVRAPRPAQPASG
ncbi:MAG TPA: hypothetical protein VIC61_09835 [Gammaproteobacteria bacterium]|jgi:hypothetical protein